MNPICFNCGQSSGTIFADNKHSISYDAIVEEYKGETYFSVPGWLCIDCLPPEVREIFWPEEEKRMLH